MTPAPRAPGEITTAWLDDTLRSSGAIDGDAAIDGIAVQTIDDLGGVNGETCRIAIRYARGEGPASLIAKFPAGREGARRTAAFQHWHEREIAFYTTLAATSPIRTPRCYAAVTHDDGDTVLLLEDLRPRAQGDQIAGCDATRAREAVIAAARLHARWWNAAPDVSDAMPETTIGLDRAERVQAALGRVWARLRETAPVGPAIAAGMPALVQGYVPLLRRMASAPVTVVHGDYRLDNLFFEPQGAPGGGDVAAIDWQFTCRCRGMYDVGYFIGLDLDPAIRRAAERDLIGTYVEELARRGVRDYGVDAAWDDYRRALLLGFAVFLIGSAGDQPNARMVRVHEVGLARLAAAIEETDAFAVLD